MDELVNLMLQRQLGQQPKQYMPPQTPAQPTNGMWTKTVPATAPPPAAGGMNTPMGGPQTMGGAPGSGPPKVGAPSHIPPQAQRASNANQLESAYENNWNPNPMILRMLQGKMGG